MPQTDSQLEKLTPAEARCLAAFKAARRRMSPIPPSVQDVADEMGVTKKTASVTLQQLQEKGRVTRDGRKSRTLRLASRRTA
ncbi:MAG TPA: helix-turn-helix domain-containing protein [Candidatus Angelobacter sp.]|jgi:DNA-binding MarR family transcriptional regulator|nr:helix-turn-helix domain-containing protein [Candidatus Angelobacter sp.]